MKKFISTLVFCGVVAAVFGQTFSVLHDTMFVVTPLDSLDKKAHNEVKNLTNAKKTIKWTREIIEIAPYNQSYICDPKACYLPAASSKQFDLEAGATGSLDLHLKNDDGTKLSCAYIKIKVEEVGNPASVKTLHYYFNDCAIILDDSEAFAADVKIYPNPVADFFVLENAEQVATLRVLSRDGREVKNFNASPNQKYDLSDLPAGPYFIVLFGERGNGLRTVEVVKN